MFGRSPLVGLSLAFACLTLVMTSIDPAVNSVGSEETTTTVSVRPSLTTSIPGATTVSTEATTTTTTTEAPTTTTTSEGETTTSGDIGATTTTEPATTTTEPTTTTTEEVRITLTGVAGLTVGGELVPGPNLLRLNFFDQATNRRVYSTVYSGNSNDGSFTASLDPSITYRIDVLVCCNTPTVTLSFPDMTFSQDTEVDLTVQAVHEVFEVQDSSGSPVIGARIRVSEATGSSTGVSWTVRVHSLETDASGETRTITPVGTLATAQSTIKLVLEDGLTSPLSLGGIGGTGAVTPTADGPTTRRYLLIAPESIELTGTAGVKVLGRLTPGSYSLRINFYREDDDSLGSRVTSSGGDNDGTFSTRLISGVYYRAEVIVCCQGPTLTMTYPGLVFTADSTQDFLVDAAEVSLDFLDLNNSIVTDAELIFNGLTGTSTGGIEWSASGRPEGGGSVGRFSTVLPVGAITSPVAGTDPGLNPELAPVRLLIDETDTVPFDVPDIAYNAETITVSVHYSEELVTANSSVSLTRPWIIGLLSVTPNPGGWINADAEITWVVTDPAPTVGLPTISLANTSVTTDDDRTYYSAQACDLDDNCSKGKLVVWLDTTDPSVTITGFTGGSTLSSEPTVVCAASDSTAGIAGECTLETVPLSSVANTSGKFVTEYEVTATAIDRAGNSTAETETYKLLSDDQVAIP